MNRGAFVALVLLAAANASAEPGLQFHGDPSHPAYGSVDLTGVDTRLIETLRRTEPTSPKWVNVFSVRVVDASLRPSPLPSILGSYSILQDGVRFTPRYSLAPGLAYRAKVSLEALLPTSSILGTPPDLALDFSLPKVVIPPSTVVEAVFPSAVVVPENLLRFYVHFSAPMQRGRVRNHVYLRGRDGQPVNAAFLDLATELWDPSMRRLTLLLAPGRIKRGVGPHVQGGAPLRDGEPYSLVIDAGMKDASGTSLRGDFEKRFRVSAPRRERVNPEAWSIEEPTVGTFEPLVLHFPQSLDRALLARAIRIVDADGRQVSGHIEVARDETCWTFAPTAPWMEGPHRALVSTVLEDASGNNIRAPLDVAWRGAVLIDDPPAITLPFAPRVEPESLAVLPRVAFRREEAWPSKRASLPTGD